MYFKWSNIALIQFEIYPNESGNDLNDSCSCCGVLNLWFGDPRILKDVIGIEPDLWWKHTNVTDVMCANNYYFNLNVASVSMSHNAFQRSILFKHFQ